MLERQVMYALPREKARFLVLWIQYSDPAWDDDGTDEERSERAERQAIAEVFGAKDAEKFYDGPTEIVEVSRFAERFGT